MQNSSQIQPTPILLAVVGGNPQVITETLYGIYQSAQPLPQLIRVITTLHGKQEMLKREMFGKNGRVAQFTQEYGLQYIPFEVEHVWVIEDEQGQALDDARSLSQHTALADFITEKVRQLTQATIEGATQTIVDLPLQTQQLQKKEIEQTLKKHCAHMQGFREIKSTSKKKQLQFTPIFDQYSIHASIAGGRKSMTFLLGYAMSLFGRNHDKVSHVLVDQRVENWPEFFYPSKTQSIQPVGWKDPQLVDFSKMQVELAEIPLVRIGMSMPAAILNQSRSYSDTVELFEELQQEQVLTIDLMPIKQTNSYKVHYRVECGSQTAYLEAEKLSVLLPFAAKPITSNAKLTGKDEQLTLDILSWYATLCSNKKQTFTSKEQALIFFFKFDSSATYSEKFLTGTNDFAEENAYVTKNGHVRPKGVGGIIGGNYFSNAVRDLKASLEKQIGQAHAARYAPCEIGREKGDKAATKGHTFYGLDIKPHNITIINQPQ